MSSKCSYVDVNNKHENEFLEFLIKRLKNAGGSLQLKKISGHLSQLSLDVRSTIGTSKSDLLCFLERHSTVFCIDGDVVKIVESSKNGGYDSDNSSIEPSQSELPSRINKGKGVIIKIFPGYGFIKAKEPVKTAVYFNSLSYGNKDIDLTSSLYVGAMVFFNANKKNDDSRSKYWAIKVWKVDESDIQSNIIVLKPRKNRDSGLYDPMTLDSEGVIQNVFPNLGFIAVKGDKNNTVFFHKNRLSKYDNVVDLTKVLYKGDIVEFSAHRSTKIDAKARWEATKVWKKSNQSKETYDNKSDKSLGSHSSIPKTDVKSKHNTKEMIKNQQGKICPRSQGAVIKFGQNELADGDASVYYISGCQVTDISWEFSEGDKVFFDAVKIKSAPGWKAVLVWVGEKPDIVLPTCLGDFSEFTDDETEDNLSSHVSYSSNSSVKSDGSSFKKRKRKKETSSNVSNFSSNKDTSNSKEKLNVSLSQYSSQSSLSSYVTPQSSKRSNSNHNDEDCDKYLSTKNKALSNWGDSPCPADDDYNPISSDNYDCNSPEKSKHNEVPEVKIKEIQSVEHLGSFIEEKIENVEDELCTLEKVNEKGLISELKEASYVKKFKCIEGNIIKLYSKFAEVKEKGVKNILTFFWTNFYSNGLSVEELELDDLKQVLKIGDVIHFNYFEIVDDSGQKWQKVSLAWKDSKPTKVTEITPEDFIKQNNLSVSNKAATYITEGGNIAGKKYLTAVSDLDPNKLDDNTTSESSFEEKSLISAEQLDISKLQNKVIASLDYKTMSSIVIKILKKDLILSDSQMDLNSIAEEIINVVLENHDPRKCDNKFCQSSQKENYIKMTSNITCAVCGKDFMPNCDKVINMKKSEVEKCREDFVLNSDKSLNIKNSEVQTIITGEIIAQNIFTEC